MEEALIVFFKTLLYFFAGFFGLTFLIAASIIYTKLFILFAIILFAIYIFIEVFTGDIKVEIDW